MSSLNRTWDRALSALLIGLLTALGTTSISCQKKARLGTPPDLLELAQTSFATGDCPGAVDSMEDLLARDGITATTSEGLLSLVLCYLGGGEELRNRDRALELLRVVETREGDSKWGRQADLLLELVTHTLTLEGSLEQQDQRIQELEREVEGLKQIDTRPRAKEIPRSTTFQPLSFDFGLSDPGKRSGLPDSARRKYLIPV